jgi:hypothetical protein
MPPAYDFPLFALKFNLVTSNSALRIIVPWFAILLMTAIIAISLCNWMLPEARLADQHTGRDREGSTSGLVCCGLRIAFHSASDGRASIPERKRGFAGAKCCFLYFSACIGTLPDLDRFSTNSRRRT